MNKQTQQRIVNSIAVVMLSLLLFGVFQVFAASGGPGAPSDSGTTAAALQRTFYISSLTGTGTVYGTTARETSSGIMTAFHSWDVFASIDLSGTGYVTVTPQVSVDNVNWVTATYEYLADSMSFSNSSTVTATTTSTSTASVTSTYSVVGTGSSAPTEVTYEIKLDADGETDYFTMKAVGYYLRFRLDYSGTVTPTVRVIGRND